MGIPLCKTLTVSWHVFFSCTNTHCFGETVLERIGAWVKAHVVWAFRGLSVTIEGSQASWGFWDTECTERALEVLLAAVPRVEWVFISQPSPPTWKNTAVGWESLKPDVLGAGHGHHTGSNCQEAGHSYVHHTLFYGKNGQQAGDQNVHMWVISSQRLPTQWSSLSLSSDIACTPAFQQRSVSQQSV